MRVFGYLTLKCTFNLGRVDRASRYDFRLQQNLVFRFLFVGLHVFILYYYLLKYDNYCTGHHMR